MLFKEGSILVMAGKDDHRDRKDKVVENEKLDLRKGELSIICYGKTPTQGTDNSLSGLLIHIYYEESVLQPNLTLGNFEASRFHGRSEIDGLRVCVKNIYCRLGHIDVGGAKEIKKSAILHLVIFYMAVFAFGIESRLCRPKQNRREGAEYCA